MVLAEVEVASPMELDDAPRGSREIGGELLVVHHHGLRAPPCLPASVMQPAGEVHLIGVDEEVGVECVDGARSLHPHQQGC